MIPDITIGGAGVRTVDHLTRETERAIRRSKEVFVVDTGEGLLEFLEARCPKVTPLMAESYEAGENRLHAYHHMAARVVEAALDHAPVTLLMHGHPLVFAYPPFLVRDLAATLDLSVQILPGISSMACLFADLWLDPGVNGVQMIEATDLLLRRRALQPDVPALIWQVGNLETRLHTTRASRPERLERFVAFLRETYPADHPVTAVYASPHALAPSTRRTVPLEELPAHARELHAGVTLYVPPCAVRAIQDFDLLARLDSPEHLEAITE